jgi:hypothetical protein
MLERTDAITNEVLEPITFVLAYPTVLHFNPEDAGIALLRNVCIQTVSEHRRQTFAIPLFQSCL